MLLYFRAMFSLFLLRTISYTGHKLKFLNLQHNITISAIRTSIPKSCEIIKIALKYFLNNNYLYLNELKQLEST